MSTDPASAAATGAAAPAPGGVVLGDALKDRVRVGPAEVAYADEGGGEPVVLLHGLPTHGYLWRHVTAALSPRARCLAPDLPGLGDTEVSPFADLSIAMQAELVLELLDVLRIRTAVLVGHDVGGGVAQLVASLHPERVRALVLVDTVHGGRWPVPPVAAARRVLAVPVVRAAARLAAPSILRAALARATWGPGGPDPAAVREYQRPLRSVEGWARFRRFLAALDPRDTRQVVPESLEVPTLVVWGADDPFLPAVHGRELADAVPGARLRILGWCGHLVPEERPRELAGAVAGFLDDLEAEHRGR